MIKLKIKIKLNDFVIKVINFAAVSKDFFNGNLRTISYFDFQTLKKATKNFHPGNLLGRGGFGPVYRVLFWLNLRKHDQNYSFFFDWLRVYYEKDDVRIWFLSGLIIDYNNSCTICL